MTDSHIVVSTEVARRNYDRIMAWFDANPGKGMDELADFCDGLPRTVEEEADWSE